MSHKTICNLFRRKNTYQYIYVHINIYVFAHTSQTIVGNAHKKLARMSASKKGTEGPQQEGDFHWCCLNFFNMG